MTASAFADRLLGYPHNLIVTHDSQVITANVTNIRACYQKAFAGGAADLRVKTARVKSTTLKHAGVESCVIGQVKGLKFPASPTKSTVTFPFVFVQA